MSRIDPLEQEESLTLEAELRQALQHQRAAQEQAQETRDELTRLMIRARQILERRRCTPLSSMPPAQEIGEEDLPT